MPSASTTAPPEPLAVLRPAATSHASIHAVVLNYRTADLTIGAVESLLASDRTGIDLEITIVDNHSRDGSVERLRERFPHLTLIESNANLGFAGGNNLALRAILSAIPRNADRTKTCMLLANSDIVASPSAIRTCAAFLQQHEGVGIVGPKVVLADGSLDPACRRGFPTPARAFWKLTGLAKRFPDNPRFTGYNLTHFDENQTTEVDSVMGAFMMVRLTAIDDAGLLDEDFFMYGEDLDWSFRIKARGWRVYYHPEATVIHLKGASSRRQSYRMIYEFYRAMWLFHRKHYRQRYHPLITLLVFAGVILRGTLAMVINLSRPTARKRVA